MLTTKFTHHDRPRLRVDFTHSLPLCVRRNLEVLIPRRHERLRSPWETKSKPFVPIPCAAASGESLSKAIYASTFSITHILTNTLKVATCKFLIFSCNNKNSLVFFSYGLSANYTIKNTVLRVQGEEGTWDVRWIFKLHLIDSLCTKRHRRRNKYVNLIKGLDAAITVILRWRCWKGIEIRGEVLALGILIKCSLTNRSVLLFKTANAWK